MSDASIARKLEHLLGGAGLLLVLGVFGLPESTLFLVGWIVFLGLSILGGAYIVRRRVARRWIEAIGGPQPMHMTARTTRLDRKAEHLSTKPRDPTELQWG